MRPWNLDPSNSPVAVHNIISTMLCTASNATRACNIITFYGLVCQCDLPSNLTLSPMYRNVLQAQACMLMQLCSYGAKQSKLQAIHVMAQDVCKGFNRS